MPDYGYVQFFCEDVGLQCYVRPSAPNLFVDRAPGPGFIDWKLRIDVGSKKGILDIPVTLHGFDDSRSRSLPAHTVVALLALDENAYVASGGDYAAWSERARATDETMARRAFAEIARRHAIIEGTLGPRQSGTPLTRLMDLIPRMDRPHGVHFFQHHLPPSSPPASSRNGIVGWGVEIGAPVALALHPYGAQGTHIAHRAGDGALCGLRSVSAGHGHERVLAAWVASAKKAGLPVIDHRTRGAPPAQRGHRAPTSADDIAAASGRAMHKAGNGMATVLRRILDASRAGEPLPSALIAQAERSEKEWRDALAS